MRKTMINGEVKVEDHGKNEIKAGRNIKLKLSQNIEYSGGSKLESQDT